MPMFRKKPVVVEAIQYTEETREECIAFCNPGHVGINEEGCEYDLRCLWIHTLEGRMTASPQDWIIKGVNGEFYPCKPGIFEKTYESV